jgi:hypothetical protein
VFHSARFELLGRCRHFLPRRRDGDPVLFENALVVEERDRVGVVGQAVDLAVVSHVAERKAGHVGLERRELVSRRDFIERCQEPGRRPTRQPILADISDVRRSAGAEAKDEAVGIVRPRVVGDVHLYAGIFRLELCDVVLDGVERVVPHRELERDILRHRRMCKSEATDQH